MPHFPGVAGELLRLSTRLAVNQLRSSAWAALFVFLHALVAIGGLLLLFAGAVMLGGLDDAFAARIVIVVGSLVTFATFAVPLTEARDEILDRRALRGYGIRPWQLSLTLIAVSFVGPALIALVPLGIAPLALWGSDGEVGRLAALGAVGLALQHVISWRIGRAGGAALRTRPRARWFVRVAVALVTLVGLLAIALTALPRLVPLLTGMPRGVALEILHISASLGGDRVDELLAWTPFGVLWALPGHALFPHQLLPVADAVPIGLSIAGATVLVLVLVWHLSVRQSLRATRRTRTVRRRGVPGWFRLVPANALGAVTARSISYWIRDPRYRSAFVFLPVIPIVSLLALWVGGVPLSISSLVPLPLAVLLLAWGTLHNDVAYDSSAVWTHLAAAVPGRRDRLGRVIPVLLWGTLLLAIGVPLTVWGHGDHRITPAVAGVGAALLLGAAGVSSIWSVRSPYPAPRPGDRAFQQPALAGSSGVDAQAGSLVVILLVASPAFAASALWLLGYEGPWNWIALAAGVVVGGLVLLVGVRVGGRDFDAAAPELLDYTMRN